MRVFETEQRRSLPVLSVESVYMNVVVTDMQELIYPRRPTLTKRFYILNRALQRRHLVTFTAL
jgi:hypothetical protein